jgi:hypothetical protein
VGSESYIFVAFSKDRKDASRIGRKYPVNSAKWDRSNITSYGLLFKAWYRLFFSISMLTLLLSSARFLLITFSLHYRANTPKKLDLANVPQLAKHATRYFIDVDIRNLTPLN